MTKRTSKAQLVEPIIDYKGNLFELAEVPITAIDIPEERFRAVHDERSKHALDTSIRSMPLLNEVGLIRKGKRYTLVYGESRVLSTKKQGGKTVRAKIWPFTEAEALYAQLVENYARGDYDKVALMNIIVRLMNTGKYKQKDIADMLNIPPDHVSKIVSLADMPDEIKRMISDKELSFEHALELKRIENPDAQVDVANVLASGNYSRDAARSYIKHEYLGICDKCEKADPKKPPRQYVEGFLCDKCAPKPSKEPEPPAPAKLPVQTLDPMGSTPETSASKGLETTVPCLICTKKLREFEVAEATICVPDYTGLVTIANWFIDNTSRLPSVITKAELAQLRIVPRK